MRGERRVAPIAITGMHRSGTSMITRALHESGLHLVGTGADDLIDAADDNPEGFWENKAIVACNDDLLEATGGAWDNPPNLPPQALDDARVSHVVDAASAAVAALSERQPWGFKDPRTSLTAAFWLDLVPDLRFVVCVRHPLEVALSLKRRNQNSYSLGLALWERYYTTVLAAVPPDRRIVTHYDTFFVDPEAELARVCAFAGLDATSPRVRTDLRHHTIAVTLTDAGASPTLKALYGTLCHEADVAAPIEPVQDEGRLHRLVLDGAVAQRHADQRQAAIDRLQQREAQFRREHAAVEEELRQRVRAVERELAARLEPGPISKAARRFVRRARPYVDTPGTRVRELGRSAATSRARAAIRRAPSHGGAEPDARAPARPQAPSAPAPAPGAAGRRRTRGLLRVMRDPMSTARKLSRRLPAPARASIAAALRSGRRLERRGTAVVRGVTRPDGATAAKGPPLRRWRERYERMIAVTVPENERWLVVTAGTSRKVCGARTPRGTAFPGTSSVTPPADDLAYVARLEALRYSGYRRLVVPEGSRSWFGRHVRFRDHVTRTFRAITDEAGAGVVFDLAQPRERRGSSLRAEVTRLAAARADTPVILDWTTLGVADELAGLSTFRPPAGDRLPYLDGTVDIVVIDDAGAVDEAVRVSSLAVVSVAARGSGAEVQGVRHTGAATASEAPRVLVWSMGSDAGETWRSFLGARATEAGAEVRFADVDAECAAAVDDYDVVVFVEPLVLPLPGVIEEAASVAVACPSGAVAGKVVRADGRLDAAGGTVFSDRSVALVAEGSPELFAPWHDYVRPVCWAPGLLAATAASLREIAGPVGVTGRWFTREWCAARWEAGGSVMYHPSLTAVRVEGDGAEPALPLGTSAWQRVLDLRPRRPRELHDAAWRSLISGDDVEACRG